MLPSDTGQLVRDVRQHTPQPNPILGRLVGTAGEEKEESMSWKKRTRSAQGEASQAAEMGNSHAVRPGAARQGQGGDDCVVFCRKLLGTARDGWGGSACF